MCALVECRMQRHAQPEIQSSEEVMPLAIGADVDEVLHIDIAEPSLASTRTEGHEPAWNLKVSLKKGDQGLSQEGYLLPNGNIVCRITNSKRQSRSRSHPSGESLLHENAAFGIDCHVHLARSIALGKLRNDGK